MKPPPGPDRIHIEAFVLALFKYATAGNWVSLRAFPDKGGGNRPFRITPHQLNGNLDDLIDQASRIVELAARAPEKVVFCPPVATFTSSKQAAEANLAEGLVLSVECDAHPQAARKKLEQLLGPATLVVASGGVWTNPESGEAEPKLHLYWLLKVPARSKDEHAKLKQARRLATRIVGGDGSNVTIVHPIRWPGSLQRKGEPKPCRIVKLNPEVEIDLDAALEVLQKAAGDDYKPHDKSGNGADSIKVAGAFKHLDPNQNLGQGIEHRTATIEEIRAALAVIPNDDCDWEKWNTVGMAVYAASGGSDEGFALFDKWSQKSSKYNADHTARKWQALHGCPPTEIGAGSILYWANEAAPGWRALIGMPFEQATKIAALIPLSILDYEVKRKTVAKELGMRIGALDKIVEPMRNSARGLFGSLQGADTDDAKQEDELIAKWNERHAHVLAGAKSCVLQEFKTPEGYTNFNLLSSAAFHEWNAEYTTVRVVGKKVVEVPETTIWMESPQRRKYQDIGFFPGREVLGFYNLWRGFAVEPRKGDCSKFLAHIYENVCQGNDELYAWVMAWFADIFQHPAKKCGTSITLRGKQGVGKTKVGQVMRGLLGVHYKLVANPRYVTGQFNSHMISLLMLHADEGFWAGDKKAEGTLKDLVTGDSHPIEFKGKEAFWVDNYVRLLVGGNPDWQVPAGFEERRFAVFDVGEAHMQDHAYFAAIDAEMEAGGREALLYHLLFEVDCSKVNLRQIPHTTALLEQKLETASPEHGWWLDILSRGELPGRPSHFFGIAPKNEVPVQALYGSYIEHAKTQGVSRRAIETKLGLFLRKVVPNLRRTKKTPPSAYGPTAGERWWFYEFPPLSECRQAFIALLNEQQVLWEGEEGAEWG